MSDTGKLRLYIGLLVLVVLLAYANSAPNGFTNDDLHLYIVHNSQVTHPSLNALFTPHPFTKVFRPVTFGTFALNWKLGQESALGFHVVNILLHAMVTVLLYILLLRLFQGSSYPAELALTACLLFAAHPIHTEAVTSIVGRAELLAAGFLLAAWLLHLQDREIPALVCLILALLSKESAVVFLALIVIGDYAEGKWKPTRRYVGVAAVTLLYLGALWKVQGGHFGPGYIAPLDNPLVAIPSGPRILNAFRIGWKYVGLQFYPGTLSYDYSYNQIPLYWAWRYLLPAALATVAAVGCWILAVKQKKKGLILAGGIYMAAFATTANILIPIGTIMGERLAYLPSVGFCLLIALTWTWLLQWRQKIAWGVLALIVFALGFRTIVRNRDWKNDLTLFSADVRNAPRSAKTHHAAALAYINAGHIDFARKELDLSLQIYPNNATALATYGLLESWQGNYREAGLRMEKALDMIGRDNPAYDEITVNLATVYMRAGHMDGALELLNREIAESPLYGRAWAIRAVVHYRLGHLALAHSDAETALRLDPADASTQLALHEIGF